MKKRIFALAAIISLAVAGFSTNLAFSPQEGEETIGQAQAAAVKAAPLRTLVGQVTNIMAKAKKTEPTVFSLRFFPAEAEADSVITLAAPASLGKVNMLDLYLVQFETGAQGNQVAKLEKCDWRRVRVTSGRADSNLVVWRYRSNNETYIARVFPKKSKR